MRAWVSVATVDLVPPSGHAALAVFALAACAHGKVKLPGGPGDQAPSSLYVDRESGFSLERPTGHGWSSASAVPSPDGLVIPLLVAHSTGVQIVVQVADASANAQEMARLLRVHVDAEAGIATGRAAKIANSAGQDAYGFGFRLEDHAAGRVAVVASGPRMILVIASWPLGANRDLVGQVDRLVLSVRATPGVPTVEDDDPVPSNQSL